MKEINQSTKEKKLYVNFREHGTSDPEPDKAAAVLGEAPPTGGFVKASRLVRTEHRSPRNKSTLSNSSFVPASQLLPLPKFPNEEGPSETPPLSFKEEVGSELSIVKEDEPSIEVECGSRIGKDKYNDSVRITCPSPEEEVRCVDEYKDAAVLEEQHGIRATAGLSSPEKGVGCEPMVGKGEHKESSMKDVRFGPHDEKVVRFELNVKGDKYEDSVGIEEQKDTRRSGNVGSKDTRSIKGCFINKSECMFR